MPSFLLHAGKNTLTDNEREGQIQKTKREGYLREKEKERAVIQRNLLPVCLTAYSQVINTLKAFL